LEKKRKVTVPLGGGRGGKSTSKWKKLRRGGCQNTTVRGAMKRITRGTKSKTERGEKETRGGASVNVLEEIRKAAEGTPKRKVVEGSKNLHEVESMEEGRTWMA